MMFLIVAIAGVNIGLWGFDALANGDKWAFPVLIMFATFGLASLFNLVYVTHGHIFPTLFSATAMGVCNFVARIATCFAPVVAETPGATGIWMTTGMVTLAMVLTCFLQEH